MIALIDYGAGNLTSVRKALMALEVEFMTPTSPEEFAGAAGLIVPGVGNFAATQALVGPWRDAIGAAVERGMPLLGICVGMQWLFEGSDEAPEVPGLGVLPGRVQRLEGDAARRLKIPHVGWNALEVKPGSRLLKGLVPGTARVFHAFLRRPGDGGLRRCRHARAQLCGGGGARQRLRRAVPPGEVERRGLRILRNFLEITR